jgi:hypothetical protein
LQCSRAISIYVSELNRRLCASVEEKYTMLEKVFRRRAPRLVAENENTPDWAARQEGPVSLEEVRALATEASLAVAVDTSPAVLLSFYDYAQRSRDRGRRSA